MSKTTSYQNEKHLNNANKTIQFKIHSSEKNEHPNTSHISKQYMNMQTPLKRTMNIQQENTHTRTHTHTNSTGRSNNSIQVAIVPSFSRSSHIASGSIEMVDEVMDLVDSIENTNTDVGEKAAEKESTIDMAAMDKELASTIERTQHGLEPLQTSNLTGPVIFFRKPNSVGPYLAKSCTHLCAHPLYPKQDVVPEAKHCMTLYRKPRNVSEATRCIGSLILYRKPHITCICVRVFAFSLLHLQARMRARARTCVCCLVWVLFCEYACPSGRKSCCSVAPPTRPYPPRSIRLHPEVYLYWSDALTD